MRDTAILWIVALETLFAGALYLFLPRIARHGLLFGVYVGEQAAAGAPASRIRRIWARCVIAGTLATAMVQVALRNSTAAIVCLVAFVLLLLGLYLWAYFAARALAPPAPPAPAVAIVEEDASAGTLPYVTLVFALACGLLGFAYAAASYAELPPRIPTHFGFSGAPDAWRDKSARSVLLLPAIGVIQGFALGLLCVLVSHAKRAVRLGDDGTSLRAQLVFRRAVTRFLCGVTWVISLMLALITVFSIRTAQGLSEGLPRAVLVLAGVLVVGGVAGVVVLAVRYGQGGARLEGATAAPLTNGLADNRYWVLGMFYVNRNDPSIMVERRFGLGYTINLGNWKAVVGLIAFLVLLLGIPLLAAR
ncbi:MAG TPA: DUF1648 domain-containing protein [Candidatus Polarisedimenticolaceae bacterium]|nr:DUF1648 domain-containing protein [Candidatus Polarisedimenticolaceae bacterium]